MYNHNKKLNCFLLGVGAALDYIGEVVKPPPIFITKLSLEWLYRLMMEPKRLYKRYFLIIQIFIYLLIKENFKIK